jgi:hypothetical protein
MISMFYRNVCFKAVAVRVLVLVALLVGSGADAKGQGNELWGIDWESNAGQVKQMLKKQGFRVVDLGKDSNGRWLKFEKGRFLDFYCDVRTNWVGKKLKKVIVDLAEVGPKTAGVYRELIEHFQQNYGSSSLTDAYYLKILPPVKVELTAWQVRNEKKTAFEVILTRTGTEEGADEEPKNSRIEITYVKMDAQ